MGWTYGCNDHIELRSIEEEIKTANWKSTGSPVGDYLSLCNVLALTPHPAVQRALENRENARVMISSIHLDVPTTKLIMHVISAHPGFSELKLTNVDLDTGLLREISSKLPTNLKNLTIETLPAFESALSPTLALDEAENDRKSRDGDMGAVGNFFQDFVGEASPLETLTLRQCRLRAEILPSSFSAPKIQHLNFYDNVQIGDSGAEALAKAIGGLFSLVSLNMSKCGLTDRGLAALLTAFSGKVASPEEISDYDKKLKDAEAKAKKTKPPSAVVMSEDMQTIGDRKYLFRFINFKLLHACFNHIACLDAGILPLGYKNPVLALLGCPVADTHAASQETSQGWVIKLK